MTVNTFHCPIELIAIDLDGTLVDSVGDLHAAVAQMLSALALQSADIEDVRQWVGNGIEKLVHRSLTRSINVEAPENQFKAALALFENAYKAINGQKSKLYPGVAQGLEWLASLDKPMVMVTNKAAQFAYPLLEAMHIDQYFGLCIAGDEAQAKKPDPAALLLAASRYRVNPRHGVLIGDSVSDIKAARAAGFSSISVSYGYNHGVPVRSLEGDLKSDAIIDSFTELPTIFKHFTM